MSLELGGLHCLLPLTAGAACLFTSVAYRRLELKHPEITRLFYTTIAVSALYVSAYLVTLHGWLIPLPSIDFVETPIEEVEARIRSSAMTTTLTGMAVFSGLLACYYKAGLVMENGITKMDELLLRDPEKDLRTKSGKSLPNGCSVLTFAIIFIMFVALWPSSWLFTFSYTIFEYDGIEVTTDHLFWAINTFALAKTISALLHCWARPTLLFSNGVHVWINICWFYGMALVAAVSAFWALSHDVLLVYLYKATMLIQHKQRLDSITVNGVPSQFNKLTGPMADFLLEGVFTRTDGASVISRLHEQLSVFEGVIDHSIWIVFLWITVLFPFCQVMAVYLTLRGKKTI